MDVFAGQVVRSRHRTLTAIVSSNTIAYYCYSRSKPAFSILELNRIKLGCVSDFISMSKSYSSKRLNILKSLAVTKGNINYLLRGVTTL